MKFSDKYKALCITFLISGTIVLAMFNLHIRQHETRIAETFYDIQPEKEISQKEILERLEQQLKEEQVKEARKYFYSSKYSLIEEGEKKWNNSYHAFIMYDA